MSDSQNLPPVPEPGFRVEELPERWEAVAAKIGSKNEFAAGRSLQLESCAEALREALQHAQQADGKAVGAVVEPLVEQEFGHSRAAILDTALPVGTKLYTRPAASSTEQPAEDWRDSGLPPNCPTISDDEPVKIVWRDEQGRRCTAWKSATEIGRKFSAVDGDVAKQWAESASQQGGVPESAKTVIRLATELCDAVDAAESDVGGHRNMREILGELGPACDSAKVLLTATPSTAGAGSQTLTLTVREIQDLAEFAGLKVSVDSVVMDEGDLDAEFTVAKCPPQGVRCEGEPDDPDSVAHYRYVAYCADYPDEGCFGLGLEIEPKPAAQEGKPS